MKFTGSASETGSAQVSNSTTESERSTAVDILGTFRNDQLQLQLIVQGFIFSKEAATIVAKGLRRSMPNIYLSLD